jgi:hypothetical protein
MMILMMNVDIHRLYVCVLCHRTIVLTSNVTECAEDHCWNDHRYVDIECAFAVQFGLPRTCILAVTRNWRSNIQVVFVQCSA